MANDFQVDGTNRAARFRLRVYRGDGMALLAMNWKRGKPPRDFVGFAIEYREPEGDRFFALKNRLGFATADGGVDRNRLSTRLSPIQKFRWVHFPRNAEIHGKFEYRVTPVFMNTDEELSYGEAQRVLIELRRETHPGVLNVTFTRGFVSSQAFVDKYVTGSGNAAIKSLLPAKAEDGLDFAPTHPKAAEALAWMGFEARSAILELLDEAIADADAQVGAVLYDLNEPEIVTRLEALGPRLRIIIDDDGKHGDPTSPETAAASRLAASAGAEQVHRQHLGKLQHNKTLVVDGPRVKAVLCGSTNHSWRGLYVQNNHAVILRGDTAVSRFAEAFERYWESGDKVPAFAGGPSATWQSLGLDGVDADVTFSPHAADNAVLDGIAADVADGTVSNLFFSLAFLYQTKGAMKDAFLKIKDDGRVFSYGISDHLVEGFEDETSGIELQKPDGSVTLVAPAALADHVPEPFKAEPTGGGGTRMHHKFVVIDFDRPEARVYLGSYNFSVAADRSNGENLLVIRDRRVAVSFVIEALRIFDHYHFRLAQADAERAQTRLHLAKPPPDAAGSPWWQAYYDDPRKILDRKLFAG